MRSARIPCSYLKALVLKDTLDRRVFAGWRQLGLENHTERPVAYNFALSVLQVLGFARYTILDSLADDFCR